MRIMAERINRLGLRNCEQNPKSTRSAVRRLGARRRDRRITKSCCLRMRFSASTALIPPLPRTVIKPASRRRIGQNQYSISITLPASTSKASKARSGSRGTATANSPCTGAALVCRWRAGPHAGELAVAQSSASHSRQRDHARLVWNAPGRRPSLDVQHRLRALLEKS